MVLKYFEKLLHLRPTSAPDPQIMIPSAFASKGTWNSISKSVLFVRYGLGIGRLRVSSSARSNSRWRSGHKRGDVVVTLESRSVGLLTALCRQAAAARLVTYLMIVHIKVLQRVTPVARRHHDPFGALHRSDAAEHRRARGGVVCTGHAQQPTADGIIPEGILHGIRVAHPCHIAVGKDLGFVRANRDAWNIDGIAGFALN
jgi:hypothetical protein